MATLSSQNVWLHFSIATVKLCSDGFLFFFDYVFWEHNRDTTPQNKM